MSTRGKPSSIESVSAVFANPARSKSLRVPTYSIVVALYDKLYTMRPDAVIALNRAVAIGELHGAAAGLDALDSLDVALVEDYQPYHAARADLLARTGRRDATVAADDRAIELTTSPSARRFIERQRRTAADRT